MTKHAMTLAAAAWLFGACGAAEDAEPETADATALETTEPESKGVPPILVAIDTLAFTTQDPDDDGVAPGFDLDGIVSADGDPESCGHGDFTSPDGRAGIDNQLATLVPLFELVGIGAAEGLIQGAIEDGGLLLLLQIDGVDDRVDDPEVTVTVRAGTGVPLLGTDGKLLSGQTFELHPETPDSVAEVGSIEGGILRAGPFEATLPILVFGMKYELTIRGARLQAELTEHGGLTNGLFGGGVKLDDLYEVGKIAAADDASVLPAIQAVFSGAGDLDRGEDDSCQQISTALALTAVSAFLFSPPEAQP